MSTPTSSRGGRWGLIGTVAFVALFVWLRWYSSFWQNRWIGFILGVLFVSSAAFKRRGLRQYLEIAHDNDLPKRVTVLTAIVFTWMAVSALKSFFTGPPFFFSSGVRAASDNAFFGVVLCVNAVQWLFASWAILRKIPDQSSRNPVVHANHG
ncbi:MAG: hypothetical protein LAP86_02995 [Acidobacteriia bacterium]|nr:hypothetical protein [Terriglobia bacterium]